MEIRSPILFLLLLLNLCLQITFATTPEPQLAFYYGANPPVAKLKLFPNVVLEPSSGANPYEWEDTNQTAYAYVSLGETISLNQYQKPIDKTWLLGKNTTWHSLVLDQSNVQWQQYFINELITPLWNQGYRGFFLDTLDSYRLAVSSPEDIKKQQAGLIESISAIKSRYPSAKIILNRGFEIMPALKNDVAGVAAESLFYSWNNAKKTYAQVNETSRQQLLLELNKVKAMGIPVTVIDYLPKEKANEAQALAAKIASLGFNPWITNNDLTALNLLKLNKPARKILLFNEGKVGSTDDKMNSDALRTLAMPLNYMGYVTELLNINDPLPPHISKADYAGVVLLLSGEILGKSRELQQFYATVMKDNIPLVILNTFGFEMTPESLKPFGLSLPLFITHDAQTLKVVYQSKMIGYELQPILKTSDFFPVTIQQGTPLLKIADELNVVEDVAAITPWGGYYLTPAIVSTEGTSSRWIIDPFPFLIQTLRLPNRPIPDTTTENGRRLMLIHIDGDGFPNKGDWRNASYSGEIMRAEIFEHYKVPTTVSIIQGELAANGLYPKISHELEAIARKIFLMPWVEIGSHTFSHPYDWEDAAKASDKIPNPFSLPIPNYKFNLETEITGSIEYINKTLAPPGKKCKILLWSGQGDASEEALALTYKNKVANMNPGTIISKFDNSMANVSSQGVFKGEYFQVFAPIGNDFEISHNTPTFYSFIETIDAFKLTDTPRRLKPIDIYYHFYMVSQLGGLKALRTVYDWALSQPVMNIFSTEFVDKIIDFNSLSMLESDNGWLFETDDKVREIRIPKTMGYPDLKNSANVIGFNAYNDDYYLHLGPGGESLIRLSQDAPTIPYLLEANARVTHFERKEKEIKISVEGHLPPILVFENAKNCALWNNQEKITPTSDQNGQARYEFTNGLQYDFSLKC